MKTTLLFAALLAHAQSGAMVKAGTLTTTYADPGIRGSGVMFDVEVLSNPLRVTSIDLNLPPGSQSLAVYSKPGTHVGFESDEAAWTLFDILSGVIGVGTGESTAVDFSDFTLPANATSALYVTSVDDLIVYTEGTGVGNVLAANADLRILEGTGVFYSFIPGVSPRQFNGAIHYELAPEPTGLALACLGLSLITTRRRRGTPSR